MTNNTIFLCAPIKTYFLLQDAGYTCKYDIYADMPPMLTIMNVKKVDKEKLVTIRRFASLKQNT